MTWKFLGEGATDPKKSFSRPHKQNQAQFTQLYPPLIQTSFNLSFHSCRFFYTDGCAGWAKRQVRGLARGPGRSQKDTGS